MTAPQSNVEPISPKPAPFHPAGVPLHVVERETEAQLQDLNRMRAVGMGFIDRLDRRAQGLLRFDEEKAFESSGDIFLGFARVSRAVRQIIVLEQEIFGLPQPPGLRAVNTNAPRATKPASAERDREDERDSERSDLNDLDDYDNGPTGEVMARIRKTLDAESSFVGWVEPRETHQAQPSEPAMPDVEPPAKTMGFRSTQPILRGQQSRSPVKPNGAPARCRGPP